MTEPEAEPPLVNAVMTFTESGSGRRWLAGAWIGPLCDEGDIDNRLDLRATLDRVFVLTSFKVVRDDHA